MLKLNVVKTTVVEKIWRVKKRMIEKNDENNRSILKAFIIYYFVFSLCFTAHSSNCGEIIVNMVIFYRRLCHANKLNEQ